MSYSIISWGIVPSGTNAAVSSSALEVGTVATNSSLPNTLSEYGAFDYTYTIPSSIGTWLNLGNAGTNSADFWKQQGTIYDVFLSGGSSVSFAMIDPRFNPGQPNSYNTTYPCTSFPQTTSGRNETLVASQCNSTWINCLTVKNLTSASDCFWFRFSFPNLPLNSATMRFPPGVDCFIQAMAAYPPASTLPPPYVQTPTGISLLSSTPISLKGAGATGAAPGISFQPIGSFSQAVTWSSDSQQIATVDPKSGLITAVSSGSAYITATAVLPSGNKLTASELISVTVPVLATGLLLTPSSPQTVLLKDPAPVLTAQLQPSNTEVKTLTWLSSETSVATVDSTGKVNLAGPGTTTITASTTDGSKHSASTTITVVSQVTDITFNSSSVTLNTLSQPYTPKFTVSPSNASNTALTWSSGTQAVASVDAAGKVTPLSNGTTVITATANDGGTASARFKVTVASTAPSVKISSISFNGVSNVPLNTLNKPYTPTFTITPSNASNPALTWSSGTQAVASVDAAGKVTPLSNGTTVITATANDGGTASARFKVTVASTAPSVKISSISFNGVSNVPLNTLNKPYTPTFTITPSNASNPALTWSSGTQAVASVDAATGMVTPLANGTTVITATANDGSNVSAALTVVVKDSGKLKPITLILIIAGVVVCLGVALAAFFVYRRKRKSVQATPKVEARKQNPRRRFGLS